MASKIAAFKKMSASTPRGRSLGVISFIGNNCGFIEREDLKKFSFVFEAFIGKRTLLVPGVKVHFTVVRNLGKECAVDVKVAPGGTDDIDSTVYEGVVITSLYDDGAKETNLGCIRTIISTDPIKLPYSKADTNVTLLLYDRVEFQLLTNVITMEQRATNIKPKIPDTFQLTKEFREMGVIMSKTDGNLTIMTEKHDNLAASAADSLTDAELNVMDEVELTIFTVDDTKKAVRLKKLPEGSVTFNQQAKGNDKWKPVTTEANCSISSEKYEGTVIRIASKESSTQDKEVDCQLPTLGLLVTTLEEGTEKRLSFKLGDVMSKATMMNGDKVQFHICSNSVTNEECAVNVEILPETFLSDTEEQRKIGLVIKLDDKCGYIKTQQEPQLLFDLCEVMEDAKLALSEKVEFTQVPNEAVEGGKQAVRIRRLNESVFTTAPKLEAFGVKEKKKMTIKLLKDPKDIKQEAKMEEKDSDSMNGQPNKASSLNDLKKESVVKQENAKGDRARSRSRESSRRRYSRSRSRSRSRERGRHRYSRSRSRSQDRSRSHYKKYRSSSCERKDGRYRSKRSRSKDRSERSHRSNSRSRSRERSSQSSRKRSRSPIDQYGRSIKLNPSKESDSKKTGKSPDGDVDDELLRKKRELMELNELIARKKAIVALEQSAKKIEPEGESGVTTFDYEHMHRENVWTPDLKPVKSILKKQSEAPIDPIPQASASNEPPGSVKSENQEMQIGYHQQTSAYSSIIPGLSLFETNSERTSTAGSEKIYLPLVEDEELIRKKMQFDELSETIARKRAIMAMKQKVKVLQDLEPEMETEYDQDSDNDDQLVMSKGNLWSSKVKPKIQPKRSILKKQSEILSSQSDTTSVDEYGQPCQDDSPFTIPSPQAKVAALFNRPLNPQPIQSVSMGFFNRMKQEPSAASQVTETPTFNKLVMPQLFMQAASSKSLLSQKPSTVSKAHDDQPGASSRQPHNPPQSSIPSTSQSSSSDKKGNLTTQMERFLSALNKADTSVVNSLFQEARKDQALMNTKKPTLVPAERRIPLIDEIYDPFKEDEDNDQPSLLGKHSGPERAIKDSGRDDLLPHERAVQDGSGFSRLVGMKYSVDPTSKAGKNPYGHQMLSENWSMFKEDPSLFSEQWKQYEKDANLYATEQKQYPEEHRQSVEYEEVRQDAQHSYVEDRRLPGAFSKSLARQESEESTDEKDRKLESFEKLQSLLQTIGLNLDTSEVSKLADRTQERLYGKMKKPLSAASHSFEHKRERSMSQSEKRGSSSRADSSDSEGFRSVSPAQSSTRKVYMSYKELKSKDQDKVGEVDLTSIKRTIINVKQTEDEQDPNNTSSEQNAATEGSFQPGTVQQDFSQYTQNYAMSAQQYSQYQSSSQHAWGAYPYGTAPSSSQIGYTSGYQAMAPHMMAAYNSYSSYNASMSNPYYMHPTFMPYSYGQLSTPSPQQQSVSNAPYAKPVVGKNTAEKIKPPVRCLTTIETLKMDSTLINIQTVKDSEAKCASEDVKDKQVPAITEDDIKAKQKKRLEQFNQRMKLKKEKQMEAQRSRGQNQNSAPGKGASVDIKNVWICGHSLVFWAEKRATSAEFGMQLGMRSDFARVWWKGVQGMTWKQLVPLLHQLKDNWPKPDVLIIHLGGNDISTTSPEDFIQTVKNDMTSLKSIFPGCLLVWSSILSRRSWRGTEDGKQMDIIRLAINDSIETVMLELGGSALSHINITSGLGIYRPDGVHLSGKGIDVFNQNIQAFLEKWEQETNKTEVPSD
ncbi:uncharacterized protein LOC130239252 isoform X2 [Danio aesculapii]|uniref:uncharacterized protein LOC130239252 isoform X2 n=1 Tax=Danio aesculapii TaxID=1142201 RepID=UPI0024C05A12|nr:uncharacterized protein LOC130239252 isoform X2 [Danio aesculapii]